MTITILGSLATDISYEAWESLMLRKFVTTPISEFIVTRTRNILNGFAAMFADAHGCKLTIADHESKELRNLQLLGQTDLVVVFIPGNPVNEVLTNNVVRNAAKPALIINCEKAFPDRIRPEELISTDQELALISKAQTGDESALKQLIAANQRLITAIAKHYTSSTQPLQPLINLATEAFITAIHHFSPSRGFKLFPFSLPYIHQSLRNTAKTK